MTQLSTILERSQEIQDIAANVGFRDVHIVKIVKEADFEDGGDELHLLVKLDKNHPKSGEINAALFTYKIRTDFDCFTDVIIEDLLPDYELISYKQKSFPLSFQHSEEIYSLFKGNIVFKSPEEISQQENQFFQNLYEEIMREKKSSGEQEGFLLEKVGLFGKSQIISLPHEQEYYNALKSVGEEERISHLSWMCHQFNLGFMIVTNGPQKKAQ